MAAPVAPHVAEELWSRLGHPGVARARAVPAGRPGVPGRGDGHLRGPGAGKVRDRLEVPPSIDEDDPASAGSRVAKAVQRALDGRASAPSSCGRRSSSTSSRPDARTLHRRKALAPWAGTSRSSPTRRPTCRRPAAPAECRHRGRAAPGRRGRTSARARASTFGPRDLADALRRSGAGEHVAAVARRRSSTPTRPRRRPVPPAIVSVHISSETCPAPPTRAARRG